MIFPYLIILLTLELTYFKIAQVFKIIDIPNSRSSHQEITIRGGGIIFTFSALIWFFDNGFAYFYFIIGLLILSVISFVDDIYNVKRRIRLVLHLTAVLLLFHQLNLFEMQWYVLPIATIFVIATINAYNFMDGINGILGMYSLVVLAILYYINDYIIRYTDSTFILVVILSLLVFNFFNFRSQAKCFAGDVGSVSMAFIVVFLIGQLILATSNIYFVFLLLVYGIDTSITLIFRVLRRENIFEAHRSHFYQYLVNERKIGHLSVSLMYALSQLFASILLLKLIGEGREHYTLLIVFVFVLSYIATRFILEGKAKILKGIN